MKDAREYAESLIPDSALGWREYHAATIDVYIEAIKAAQIDALRWAQHQIAHYGGNEWGNSEIEAKIKELEGGGK